MKALKQLAIVLLLISFIMPAQSAKAESKSYIHCDCLFGRCTCFIQQGDEGGAVKIIIQKLIEKGYLSKGTKKSIFSGIVENAVIKFQADNNLEQTGMMDDDTLTLLLWGIMPEELDKSYGSDAECKTVFIPTDGGKKRHSNDRCSRMEDPRKVSDRNAEKLGFDPCKKCYRK